MNGLSVTLEKGFKMYQTGTYIDFEQRLHQLPSSTDDLDLFWEESLGYDEIWGLSSKWEKEFSKKQTIFNWTRRE